MSEDFLSRWSRRKREATTEIEGEDKDKARTGASEPAADVAAQAEQAADPVGAAPAGPALDLPHLPPIEAITAASDIRPFLAPGVPEKIARAALRRAWTVDPQIRNFVGLADYDWDYHAPNSAAGFGPLEMTDELRQAVLRIIGEVPSGPEDATAGTHSVETLSSTALPATAPAQVALSQDPPTSRSDADTPSNVLLPPKGAYTAAQNRAGEGRLDDSRTRRAHGRALPK